MPPERLQCCRRVLCLGIDVDVRSEFLRQVLFCRGPHQSRRCAQAHFSCKLHAKVGQARSYSLNGQQCRRHVRCYEARC